MFIYANCVASAVKTQHINQPNNTMQNLQAYESKPMTAHSSAAEHILSADRGQLNHTNTEY
jgi:hypothetical protein